MSSFKRTRAGITLLLDPVETAVLAQVINEMTEVIGPEPVPADGEAWARELGLAGLGQPDGPPSSPHDPISCAALSRRLPRMTMPQARDFRRFTEDDLRAAKLANARALLIRCPKAAARSRSMTSPARLGSGR